MSDNASARGTPHLRAHGDATQLVVDGTPFLVIGGELHNSSSSSMAYMQPIWERLVALELNTVLAAVSWELTEPQEGAFDFALVDALVTEARRYGLRLILLWFGSWKNGMSSYVPSWVKRDAQRFPLAMLKDGHSVTVLSPFAEESCRADASAFAALMRHLREIDEHEHTVIMVQVENEVGILGDSRDRSAAAEAALAGPVPPALLAALQENRQQIAPELAALWDAAGSKTAGSWQEVFGASASADELLMAWQYGCYVDSVAAAGKAEYDLPLFVNAWLNAAVPTENNAAAGGQQPGDYPSGGPLPHVLDVWRAAAPHIDLFAPDIYFGDFEEWCRLYCRQGNPLLIPEMRRDPTGARHIFTAVGSYNAIGVSPFAIDSFGAGEETVLRTIYGLLRQMAPLILAHQGQGTMIGFRLDEQTPTIVRDLGGYTLEVSLDQGFGSQSAHGYGIIIATEADMFVGAGYGFQVVFRPADAGAASVGIDAVDEGIYRGEEWVCGRRLNGDETFSGSRWRFPPLEQRASPIPLLGAGSGIAHCRLFRYR